MSYIHSITTGLPEPSIIKTSHSHESSHSFQDAFHNALHQVNELQNESEEMTNQLITGEVEDIHQVTIAAEKASLALQATVQTRNKMVEAYQEIMRMQV